MFDNIPDNVNHSDFNEPISDSYIEHISEQLPKWLEELAEEQIADIVKTDLENGIDEEVTIQKIKELPEGDLVEKYVFDFDYYLGEHSADYLEALLGDWSVDYDKYSERLNLMPKANNVKRYVVVSLSLFKDFDGNYEDEIYSKIIGQYDGERFTEKMASIEPDLEYDLFKDTYNIKKAIEPILALAKDKLK